MKVQELVDVLNKFSPDDEVQIGVIWPDRVTETYQTIWIGDYGGGPQINAVMDFKGVSVLVNCVLQQRVKDKPQRTLDLGRYESAEIAAKVRDFYVVHHGLKEPLNFPDFDYEKWIPPRMTSGQYNEHIAKILREKLLRD